MQSAPEARLNPIKHLDDLREKFRRGVSLEEFRSLYHQYQHSVESHSEFRRVDAAIQFLEDHGGYSYPEPEPGAWITEGTAWVAVDGVLPLHRHPADWFVGQIEHKYLINVMGLRTKVLIMDAVTARIWQLLSPNPISYEKALHWTLLVRPLVGDNPRDMDIYSLIKSQRDQGVDPSHAITNGRFNVVAENTRVPSLRDILDGKWVATPRRLTWFDGTYHLLLVPAWVLSLDPDYVVNDWTYFI